MKIFQTPAAAKTVLFAALAVLGSTAVNAQDDVSSFSEVTSAIIDQGVTKIVVGPECENENGMYVPNTMFTIVPADTVTVSSSPANLVTVSNDGETMRLEWDDNVAHTAASTDDGGGVIIGIPAGQLTSVTVRSSSSAQIIDGFASVSSLDVYGASTLWATFSSLVVSGMSLSVSGASTVHIKSNVNITGGGISGASNANVETPTYTTFDVSGASNLRVVGNIDSGSVSGASAVTATGSTTGTISNSFASTINVESCGTSVSNSGAASCNSGTQSVTVDTSQQAFVLNGKGFCGIKTLVDAIIQDVEVPAEVASEDDANDSDESDDDSDEADVKFSGNNMAAFKSENGSAATALSATHILGVATAILGWLIFSL